MEEMTRILVWQGLSELTAPHVAGGGVRKSKLGCLDGCRLEFSPALVLWALWNEHTKQYF